MLLFDSNDMHKFLWDSDLRGCGHQFSVVSTIAKTLIENEVVFE